MSTPSLAFLPLLRELLCWLHLCSVFRQAHCVSCVDTAPSASALFQLLWSKAPRPTLTELLRFPKHWAFTKWTLAQMVAITLQTDKCHSPKWLGLPRQGPWSSETISNLLSIGRKDGFTLTVSMSNLYGGIELDRCPLRLTQAAALRSHQENDSSFKSGKLRLTKKDCPSLSLHSCFHVPDFFFLKASSVCLRMHWNQPLFFPMPNSWQ